MPLKQSCSITAYNDNVGELIKSGRNSSQAVAIAIRTLKKSCGVSSENRMTPKEIVKKNEDTEIASLLHLCEAKAQSGSLTGSTLKDKLDGYEEFSHLKDNDWVEFGKLSKELGATPAVFSGAIRGFIRYHKRGWAFPATEAFVLQRNSFKTEKYKQSMMLEIMVKSHILQKKDVHTKALIKNGMFLDSEKNELNRKDKVTAYVYTHEFLSGLGKFFERSNIGVRFEKTNEERLRSIAEMMIGCVTSMKPQFEDFDEVLDAFEEKEIPMIAKESDLVLVNEFKKQNMTVSGGPYKIMNARLFWEEIAKNCQSVADCLRIYSVAIENEIIGVGDFFKTRAIELANKGVWV